MSKAYIVKTNKGIMVEPYSDSNQNSIYVLAKLKLPKGNYLISAEVFLHAPQGDYKDTFTHGVAISLACNGRCDMGYAELYPPIHKGEMILNLPVKLESDAEVNLKARALYRSIYIVDAQITALSVDELNISTGNTSSFTNNSANFHWFNEENGDAFIQNDYMDLKDNNIIKFKEGLKEKLLVSNIRRNWFGRIIDWLSWTKM